MVIQDVLKLSDMTEFGELFGLFIPHLLNSSRISFSGSLINIVIKFWARRVDSGEPLKKEFKGENTIIVKVLHQNFIIQMHKKNQK